MPLNFSSDAGWTPIGNCALDTMRVYSRAWLMGSCPSMTPPGWGRVGPGTCPPAPYSPSRGVVGDGNAEAEAWAKDKAEKGAAGACIAAAGPEGAAACAVIVGPVVGAAWDGLKAVGGAIVGLFGGGPGMNYQANNEQFVWQGVRPWWNNVLAVLKKAYADAYALVGLPPPSDGEVEADWMYYAHLRGFDAPAGWKSPDGQLQLYQAGGAPFSSINAEDKGIWWMSHFLPASSGWPDKPDQAQAEQYMNARNWFISTYRQAPANQAGADVIQALPAKAVAASVKAGHPFEVKSVKMTDEQLRVACAKPELVPAFMKGWCADYEKRQSGKKLVQPDQKAAAAAGASGGSAPAGRSATGVVLGAVLVLGAAGAGLWWWDTRGKSATEKQAKVR